MLAEIKYEFSANLTYTELPLLPPKMTTDMKSLSGSAGGLGAVILPSVGHVQFEFLLLLLTASGVAVFGVAISVITWTAWAVLARASNAGQSDLLVRTLDENAGASGRNTTGGVA